MYYKFAIIFALSFIYSINLYSTDLDEVDQVVSQFISKHPIEKLKWDWGESVFLFGLSKHPRFNQHLKRYTERWIKKGPPKTDRSDRCPSALAAVQMVKTGMVPEAKSLAQEVENYIKRGPHNRLGTLDHLGNSWLSHIYPSSIWVDSLMMYGVFAGEWGKLQNDRELITFALLQPFRFAQVLRDQKFGLFRHAYLLHRHKTVPSSETFWLRGNAWVLTSMIELIENFKDDFEYRDLVEQNIAIFKALSSAVIKFQKANGAYETVINRPGYSYDETSGTLLVAYAFAKAHRLGLLSEEYLLSSQKSFSFGQRQLRKSKNGLSLGGISGPTNPGPAFYYKLIRKKTDLSYGVGAYLLAASELLGH